MHHQTEADSLRDLFLQETRDHNVTQWPQSDLPSAWLRACAHPSWGAVLSGPGFLTNRLPPPTAPLGGEGPGTSLWGDPSGSGLNLQCDRTNAHCSWTPSTVAWTRVTATWIPELFCDRARSFVKNRKNGDQESNDDVSSQRPAGQGVLSQPKKRNFVALLSRTWNKAQGCSFGVC